jgi:eukaryotic-like serine/threonine-protein kinase
MRKDNTRITRPQTLDIQAKSKGPLPLPVVGAENYIREGEVGRGGLGRIVQAKDTRLDRTVALKELLSNQQETQRRFIREAKITAKLQHPSIVPVYEAGCWPSGEPFFAMKLVNGRGFDLVMSEKITFAERLSLLPSMIDVCEAMAYAHSKRTVILSLLIFYSETSVRSWSLTGASPRRSTKRR